MWQLISNSTCGKSWPCRAVIPLYIGFIPQSSGVSLSDDALLGLNSTLTDPNNIKFPHTLDETISDHVRFYATTIKVEDDSVDGFSTNFSASTYETIECGLYNASYVVKFSFNNGLQDVVVTDMTKLNGVYGQQAYDQCGWVDGPCSGPAMAYYSLMDALGNQMIGTLGSFEHGPPLPDRTQITNTVLLETMDIQNSIKATYRQPLSIANMTLGEALEQSILNATLSLFSDSYFL